MSWGGLVRDEHNTWICSFQAFEVVRSSIISEANVLCECLSLIWNRGYQNVICELAR